MTDAGIRREPWHETVTVRGLRHHLRWWGERTADPIVFLHGWMDTGATWQFLIDELPVGWSCVAPDWRGFGGTEWPVDGYWFADYFADLEALLDVLCPARPARLLAHSMGGNVASMYAGIRPDRVRWLANIEGLGLPRTSPDDAPARYAEWLDQQRQPASPRRYASIEPVVSFIMNRNPGITRPRAEFIAKAWTRKEERGGEGGESEGGGVCMAFDPRHRHVSATLYRREEAEACWRRVLAPVLLFLGGRSEIRERLGADGEPDAFRALYRDVQVVELPHVGHMMHLEDPVAVARHIAQFTASR